MFQRVAIAVAYSAVWVVTGSRLGHHWVMWQRIIATGNLAADEKQRKKR